MRRLLTAVAAAMLCTGLAACSTAPTPSPTPTAPTHGTSMTPDGAKAAVLALYRETAPLISSQGWSENGSWTTCGDGDLHTAQWNLSATFTGRLPAAPDQLVGRLAQEWASRGFDAKETVDTGLTPTRYVISDPPFLSGSNADGSLYQLELSTLGAGFQATSPCVTGSIAELNK